ncbi:MAG: nicotinate-nucleotide adenylyltransferase [Bacillota bacterium]
MKIGIMGGTFDPVHNAHLKAAQVVCKACALDTVMLMPSNVPPHKAGRTIASASDRVEMLRLAVASLAASENTDCLNVSTIEVDRPGTTYTIDTLRMLASGGAEYFYLVGADVVFDLLNWKDCTEVFKLCTFIAMLRPGFERSQFDQQVRELKEFHAVKMLVVEIPQMDMSSTEIRESIAHCEKSEFAELKTWLPVPVFDYIIDKNLYGAGEKIV